MEIFKNIAVKKSYQECLLVVTILIVNIDVGFKVTGAKELSEETSALLWSLKSIAWPTISWAPPLRSPRVQTPKAPVFAVCVKNCFWDPSWLLLIFFLEVEHQESIDNHLPRNLKISIFKNTTLISRIIILFQDCDPSLSIMSSIWEVMCLAVLLRDSDRQRLVQLIHTHPKNERFLETLTKSFVYQKFTRLPEMQRPYLNRIFGDEELLPDNFFGQNPRWWYLQVSSFLSFLTPKFHLLLIPATIGFFCELSCVRRPFIMGKVRNEEASSEGWGHNRGLCLEIHQWCQYGIVSPNLKLKRWYFFPGFDTTFGMVCGFALPRNFRFHPRRWDFFFTICHFDSGSIFFPSF